MIDKSKLHTIMKKAFPQARVKSFHKSPVARINWVYRVNLENPDKKVILRISPLDHPWKIDKEKKIHEIVSKTKLPIPKFLHVDSSKEIIPNHYQIMEHLPGERWGQIIDNIQDKNNAYFELGKTLGKIHSLKLKEFGWIHCQQEHVHTKSNSWKEVFILMCIDELLEISQQRFLELGLFIQDFVDVNQHLLDIDIKPRLLHNDFCHDNILVTNSDEKVNISGILDFEWAFSGHNEFELSKVVSQLLLDYPSHEYKKEAQDFFRGYKKHCSISDDFEKRRPLYTLYHLLHWANHCAKNKTRCLESGINVDQVLDYFYNDISDIVK